MSLQDTNLLDILQSSKPGILAMSNVLPWSYFLVISCMLGILKSSKEKGSSLLNKIQVVHVSHPVSPQHIAGHAWGVGDTPWLTSPKTAV